MSDYNRVILCGRLGRDAELRYTSGGAPVATLNLATTEVWKDKSGEKRERTEWSRCVLWGKQAETLAEYLVKGKQVLVEGRLSTRKWTDRNGNEKYTTEVNVFQVVLLGGGNGQGRSRRDEGGEAREPAVDRETGEVPDDSDIPF